MKTIETYIVDSFTDEPFKGNPAGVCLLKEELSESEMQSIAKELGLSETAFVVALNERNEFSIRFFSPVMEIPLCGHATLASAKVIFDKTRGDSITFINIDQLKLLIGQSDGAISMEFPIYQTIPMLSLIHI